jgi:hypothetical protein
MHGGTTKTVRSRRSIRVSTILHMQRKRAGAVVNPTSDESTASDSLSTKSDWPNKRVSVRYAPGILVNEISM